MIEHTLAGKSEVCTAGMGFAKVARVRSKPRVISLYSGAGGLDYGFEAAGFETAVAIEMNHDACETLRRNRKWRVIERDIFEIRSAEMLDASLSRFG